jgi:hypothetical protein
VSSGRGRAEAPGRPRCGKAVMNQQSLCQRPIDGASPRRYRFPGRASPTAENRARPVPSPIFLLPISSTRRLSPFRPTLRAIAIWLRTHRFRLPDAARRSGAPYGRLPPLLCRFLTGTPHRSQVDSYYPRKAGKMYACQAFIPRSIHAVGLDVTFRCR